MKKQLLIPPLFFILIIVLVYFVVFYENCAYAQIMAHNATISPDFDPTITQLDLVPIRTQLDLGPPSKRSTDTPCTDIFGNIKKDS